MHALRFDRAFDGDAAVDGPGAVLFDDGVIVDVVSGWDAVPTDAAVDRHVPTALPGLIDLHVHLLGVDSETDMGSVFAADTRRAARATGDLRRLLAAGFTTVRDCGGPIAIGLRDAVNHDDVVGPTILAAGTFVEPTGGADEESTLRERAAIGPNVGLSRARLADGPIEVRRAVREQVRAGSDLIKTCATGLAYLANLGRRDRLEWTDEELTALIDEAHRQGLRVAVHAHGSAGIEQAARLGADTVEHGMLMNEAAAEAMALAGTVYVPTVSGPRRVASRGVEHGISSDIAARAAALLPAHQAALRHALEKGVRIANGSDCCGLPVYPFGDNVEELSTLVELGMSTRQALRAATSEAAAALGLGGAIGVLRKGARADIIGMAGDPVTDIAALRDVRLVIKSGIPFVDRLAANS